MKPFVNKNDPADAEAICAAAGVARPVEAATPHP